GPFSAIPDPSDHPYARFLREFYPCAPPRASAVVEELELDAPILRTPGVGLVVGDRFVRTGAARLEPRFFHAVLHEVVLDRVGATLREREVGVACADAVGVPGDLDAQVGVLLQHFDRAIEQIERRLADRRLVEVELDAFDDAAELLDLLRTLVGAAVGILELVVGLRSEEHTSELQS